MKLLVSLVFAGLASFAFSQQTEGAKAPNKAHVKEPVKLKAKPVTAPASTNSVRKTEVAPAPAPAATESNRKRPGGTVSGSSNSKTAPTTTEPKSKVEKAKE